MVTRRLVGLLEYPLKIRPELFPAGSRSRPSSSRETMAEVDRWLADAARQKTRRNRPDLLP